MDGDKRKKSDKNLLNVVRAGVNRLRHEILIESNFLVVCLSLAA